MLKESMASDGHLIQVAKTRAEEWSGLDIEENEREK